MSETAGASLLLRDGVLLLGAAILFVLIFRRLGLGATLGYLVAGALIGPQGLGLIGGAESKMGIAELGIVLLLFLVGLELHPNRLWRLRRDIFGLGFAQVAACGLAITAVIYFSTGFSLAASLALGLPLALSSTAQVLPMLRSAGRLNTPSGERTFSVLLFQDLSIVPLITIIAALSRTPPAPGTPPGWQLAVYTVLAVVGLVLAGRFVLNPLFRLVGSLGERELFVAAGLFTVLASAAVMEALHLSTALGAFIAGVMLADSPYRHELEADVEPFRTILLGLFFITIGMMLDLHVIAERPFFVVGMATAVVAIKALVMFAIAKAFGVSNRSALAFGLLLSQGGEFAFVLFAQASDALLIQPEAASLFGAVVTLSMATTPFLMMVARRHIAEVVRHDGNHPAERPGLQRPRSCRQPARRHCQRGVRAPVSAWSADRPDVAHSVRRWTALRDRWRGVRRCLHIAARWHGADGVRAVGPARIGGVDVLAGRCPDRQGFAWATRRGRARCRCGADAGRSDGAVHIRDVRPDRRRHRDA